MTHLEHSFHPYPEYKDSGVATLGKIPIHWTVKRQRQVVEMLVSNVDKHTIEGEVSVRLCNYVDVYKNERITGQIAFMKATASANEIDRFKLRLGDVLITKDSEVWTDIGVPALVEYEAEDLVCGYHLALLRARRGMLEGEFLLRALQSTGVAVQFHVVANGVTRYGLSHQAIKNVQLPIPPFDEQQAIVRFINHIDHRVNRFIRAKQRLITLLNEQKQAIIHQAVTRGLDPHVRLKLSGVEWLGDVPEQWNIVRLGTIAASLQTGPFGSQLHAHDYKPGGIPVINPSHMKDGQIVADYNCAVGPDKFAELSRHQLQINDIVFARRGELGRCALVQDKEVGWICGTGSLRVRLKDQVGIPEYLLQLFLSKGVAEWLSLQSVGATMDNLNTGILARLPLLLPPLREQQVIVDFLYEQNLLYKSAFQKVNREIDLIREYRTRLIADVVTGKLDVRGVVLSDDLPVDNPMLSADELADDDDMAFAEEPANADD